MCVCAGRARRGGCGAGARAGGAPGGVEGSRGPGRRPGLRGGPGLAAGVGGEGKVRGALAGGSGPLGGPPRSAAVAAGAASPHCPLRAGPVSSPGTRRWRSPLLAVRGCLAPRTPPDEPAPLRPGPSGAGGARMTPVPGCRFPGPEGPDPELSGQDVCTRGSSSGDLGPVFSQELCVVAEREAPRVSGL